MAKLTNARPNEPKAERTLSHRDRQRDNSAKRDKKIKGQGDLWRFRQRRHRLLGGDRRREEPTRAAEHPGKRFQNERAGHDRIADRESPLRKNVTPNLSEVCHDRTGGCLAQGVSRDRDRRR